MAPAGARGVALSIRREPALHATRQQLLDDLQRAGIAGAARIRPATFAVIAAGASQGQITRVIWPVKRGAERARGDFAKPCARHDVLQRGAAPGRAIDAYADRAAAMQAAAAPAHGIGHGQAVAAYSGKQKLAQTGSHGGAA